MKINRPRAPIGLVISAVVVLLLGFIANPIINTLTTEEQRATNVLISAIPFVLVFVSIVLLYIILVWLVVSALSHQISYRAFRTIELITIAGIGLGAIGMFQPWWFGGYKLGFFVLLIATLSFILWSHITPKGATAKERLGSMSISQFEQGESAGG